jgi:glycine/D-amino acid oxidase-like deaminating enzyme
VDSVCVIGAGGAGLAAAHALKARDLPFVVYESGSGIGGNWRYENDSGLSSAYASLIANTSRLRTGYRAFRLPMRRPLYLGHAEMLAYLEAFTDRFRLREHIRLRSPVTAARPLAEGGWEIEAGGGPERHRTVLVATGYNSVPRYPELPGRFDGLELHSHDYRTPEPFRDRDTVVIGLGSSGAELAGDIRHAARSVTVSARSGTWLIPRLLGPLPFDCIDTRAASVVPWRLRRRLLNPVLRLTMRDLIKAGLPSPSDRPGDKPLATSDEFIDGLRSGEIQVSGPVAELAGDRVRLADGSELPADAVLYATGYRTEYPFLPPEVEPPTIERMPLYRGVAHPDAPGLFFIGLVGGHGALIPMCEAQANWVAEVLAGRLALPSAEVMRESIARDDEVRRRDFDPRWGIMWDRFPYIRALDSEARRARRAPGPSPRAAAPTVR